MAASDTSILAQVLGLGVLVTCIARLSVHFIRDISDIFLAGFTILLAGLAISWYQALARTCAVKASEAAWEKQRRRSCSTCRNFDSMK